MALKSYNHIFVTGVPGVGKTTIIKDICKILKEKNVEVAGFYTTEIRNASNSRIGFDVITLNGKTGKLARNRNLNDIISSKYTVGNYFVYVNDFELLVLPLLKQQENVIFIIDEIGKMELFSNTFKTAIEKLFTTQNIKIIATIPSTKFKPIPFIEKLKNMPNAYTILVNHSNRNNVSKKILETLNV